MVYKKSHDRLVRYIEVETEKINDKKQSYLSDVGLFRDSNKQSRTL